MKFCCIEGCQIIGSGIDGLFIQFLDFDYEFFSVLIFFSETVLMKTPKQIELNYFQCVCIRTDFIISLVRNGLLSIKTTFFKNVNSCEFGQPTKINCMPRSIILSIRIRAALVSSSEKLKPSRRTYLRFEPV